MSGNEKGGPEAALQSVGLRLLGKGQGNSQIEGSPPCEWPWANQCLEIPNTLGFRFLTRCELDG
ncbi:hypothetical protein LAB1_50570 [Roseibium sp. LAB1]